MLVTFQPAFLMQNAKSSKYIGKKFFFKKVVCALPVDL